MDHDDVVLSEVHLGARLSGDEGTAVSFFYCADEIICEEVVDEDGDLDPPRRQSRCLAIEHTFATPLANVGTQVWRGSLLM